MKIVEGEGETDLNERLKYYEIIEVNRRIEKRGVVDNSVLYNKQERLTFRSILFFFQYLMKFQSIKHYYVKHG